jgi:hypothetical protein
MLEYGTAVEAETGYAEDREFNHQRVALLSTYWWPRPGTDKPLEKTALYTKVGDKICSVGYDKE